MTYFFNQATIATMTPSALNSDIIPAGIGFPEEMNFGINCPANAIDISSASPSPTAIFPGNNHAATSRSAPQIPPAINEMVLPALR